MLNKIVVFDMDETLINSNFIWALSPSKLLQKKGIEFSEDLEQVFYREGLSSIICILKNYLPEATEKELFSELSFIVQEDYKNKASVKEGAYELISKMQSLGYVAVILTANDPKLARIIKNRFDFPVDRWFSTKELGIGKDNVHVYDLIASYYGLSAEDVVLFDDAEYALSAAYKGGIRAIRVFTEKEASEDNVPLETLYSLLDFKEEMCEDPSYK